VTSEISRLPPYLAVQFVRFYFRKDTKKKAKICRTVYFPTVLSLSLSLSHTHTHTHHTHTHTHTYTHTHTHTHTHRFWTCCPIAPRGYGSP
jgi:hypothetical protein